MRKIYATFGGAAYDRTTDLTVQHAPQFGADEVWVYDDLWLMQQDFYRENQWLWTHKGVGNPHGKRGFGWFAWKPFVVMHALDRLQDGDMVLYADADTHPIHDFSMLYDECNRIGGVMLFNAVGCWNYHWVKRDCFAVMGLDSDFYHKAQHAVARFMVFQRGHWRHRQMLMEWLTYCINPLATTFEPSVLKPELETFKEHRTEQAILTLLAHKYGHKLYREACQFGEGRPEDKDLYPTLFHQDGNHGERRLCGSKFRNVP